MRNSEIAKKKSLTLEVVSSSSEETIKAGEWLGNRLSPNSVVTFFGDLGAGKTTFIKGLVAAAAHIEPRQVNSPTFVYLNIYSGFRTIYHFDLYRLKDHRDFTSMGFEEYFTAGGICCIEWSERIEDFLPNSFISVHIAHLAENLRKIEISERGV